MPEPRDNWKAEEQAHYEQELRELNERCRRVARRREFITRALDDLSQVQPDHIVEKPKRDEEE